MKGQLQPDIIHDGDVEVVNPELYIASLDADGRLFMEMTVERGRGYVPAERNKKPGAAHWYNPGRFYI